MDILTHAKKQGIRFEVKRDKLRIISPKPIPPELVEALKVRKWNIIQALKKQNQTNEYQGQGKNKTVDSRPSEAPIFEDSRLCKGYQPPRWVHPDVCAWHVQEADPKCMGCEQLSVQDKEIWMDSYLDKAINSLNKIYQPNDRISWSNRTKVNQLEQKRTEDFLVHDVENFKNLVDQWCELFKKMRVPQGGRSRKPTDLSTYDTTKW